MKTKTPKNYGPAVYNALNNLLEHHPAVHCANDRMIRVAELRPHPKNPQLHGENQIALLAKIIAHQGWRSPIVVSRRSGYIVAGHGRLMAAQKLGLALVPVNEQDFATEADELAHLAADNRIGELAETDGALLKDLLLELDTGAFDMDLSGFDAGELERVINSFGEHPVDAEPQMDRAAELQKQWGTETGQLWACGEHRLLCGDAEKHEDVDRLLAGVVPLLCVTDPPYGVDYKPNWRNEADRANGRKRCLTDPVKTDFTDSVNSNKGGTSRGTGRAVGLVTNDTRADWREAWALFPGDVIYSWHPPGATSLVHAAALQDSGFTIRMQIIWAKNQFPIGRGDYHVKHEPCWYCVREGKPSLMVDDRTQHTLWEIDKPHKSETGHSTQKPLECMAKPIRNHNSPMVYDPFLGSGTTLIAAEGLGRKCYGIEISPGYVAVTLQRFKDATGKVPKLIDNSLA